MTPTAAQTSVTAIELAQFLVSAIHDQLRRLERERAFHLTVSLTNDRHAEELRGLPPTELLSWLAAKGYRTERREVVHRQVLRAVLLDMMSFLSAAIERAQVGEFTVAFALLRKPLKDNLLLLEWLLGDRDEFLDRFSERPELVDSSKLSADTRRGLIAKARSQCRRPGVLTPEFLHELRYEKQCPYGFDPLWNQATHLVTSFRAYPTEVENLNFVFSNPEDLTSYAETLDRALPGLLDHVTLVSLALLRPLDPAVSSSDPFDLRHDIGVILCANARKTEPGSTRELSDALCAANLVCAQCGGAVQPHEDLLLSIWRTGQALCAKCGSSVPSV